MFLQKSFEGNLIMWQWQAQYKLYWGHGAKQTLA